MRRFSAVLLFTLALFALGSCLKEKSFEVGAPASGSLRSDETGDCLPKTAVGAYIAGSALTDSNYLELDVDVANAGAYSIRTDTVNGYSFSGMGNFDHTGINHIRLAAQGTPNTEGENEFTVIYDTSFCFVPVTVLPAGSTNGPAAFTLQGNGDTCLSYTVSGAYVQNTPLDGTNSVAIRINATTPGTYTIVTNNQNGMTFSASGTISAIGEQVITLTGGGTPTEAISSVFTVTAGNTTCTFTVPVTASNNPPPVTTGDLFPMTNNSYWTYVDNGAPIGDSVVVTSQGTAPQAGNTYNIFNVTDASGQPVTTAFYRKAGNDYYNYTKVDQFTAFTFDADVFGELLFLKEGLAANDTWNSTEFSGESGGKPAKLQYIFTCTGVNGTATLNGVTYNDVTVVVTKSQTSEDGGAYVSTNEEIESYYAKGIGLIYQKISVSGTTELETFIQHYDVK